MPPELLAVFGIDDSNLSLAINLLILSLVVIWLALVYWTWSDARRRIDDEMLVTVAVIASLFPFIGTVVYSILRPPEYLDDVRERELETKASELRLRHLTEQSCPRCQHPIERTFLTCPECRTRLKDPCPSCQKPVSRNWAVCPYCEAPIAARAEEAKARARQARRTRAKQRTAQRSATTAGKPSRSETRKPSRKAKAKPAGDEERDPGAASGSQKRARSSGSGGAKAEADGKGAGSRRARREPASRRG